MDEIDPTLSLSLTSEADLPYLANLSLVVLPAK